MTPEELKHEELKHNIDKVALQVSSLSNSVNALAQKVEVDSKTSHAPKSKLDGWGNSITIIIGILTGVAILFTQLKQPENINADTEEKLSGARKNNAEALKLEHEIQLSLDSLKRKGSKDAKAYNDLLEEKLPKLQNVITRLEATRSQNQNQNLMYKYIIIWVIFIGLGWFFRIFYTLWSNLINLISFILDNRIRNSRDGKNSKRFINLSRSLSFFYSIPTIIEIVIDVNIFFILIVPIFNETAASLGSDKTFNSVSQEFSRFNIDSSIDNVKSIIAIDTLSTEGKRGK